MDKSKSDLQLVRGVGLLGLIAASFNCTVGGGIFRLPVSVYQIAGQSAPLVFLLCFFVMLLIVTIFVQVGRDIEVSGGPYAYVQPVLGPYWAFLCGVLLWAVATFAMAAVGAAHASFVSALIPALAHPLGEALILAVSFGALTYFNIAGVRSGSRVSIALSVAKIFPLALLVLAGLPNLRPQALALPEHIDFSQIARGALVLIFAFTGAESALIPSGEIANPKQNLPRALYLALFLVLFLYLGVQFVTQSELGSQMGSITQSGSSPLAIAAGQLMGPTGAFVLSIGAVLSTLGYLSAITLSLPRSLYAFARDGYLPSALAHVHPEHHTPKNAILLQVILAWIMAVSSLFEKLAVLSNLSAILMYSLCAVAAIKLGKRWIPLLALLSMGGLLLAVSVSEWISVGLVAVVATVIYFMRSKTRA